MMKSLLFVVAALLALSAGAQFKSQDVALGQPLPLTGVKPQVQVQEMQMRAPGARVAAPKKASSFEGTPYYTRPAGAFHAFQAVTADGSVGTDPSGCLMVKPYSDYTYHGVANGATVEDGFWWSFVTDDVTTENSQDLTINYDLGQFEPPVLGLGNDWNPMGTSQTNYFQYPFFFSNGVISNKEPATIISFPYPKEVYEMEFLLSSKTFCLGGRNGDQAYPMTYYSGATPYGANAKGWWFGKNGGAGNYRIDGIAQAFEKPSAPYLLKQVVLDCAVLEVADLVDMTCKVYRLDEIPAYLDDGEAMLPDEPGELIAKGRASLTPETATTADGLVFFTLFAEEDGLEYEITPTIDCAILVVIDGYNEPEMENLTDFSALISSDVTVDEGFGELAYLKIGFPDEAGNLDHYEWAGLNNFFSSGTMMTGFTIYITADLPYLVFDHKDEDGEYTFPYEGGRMDQYIGINPGPYPSIIFRSSVPSEDDGWWLSCNGDDVPDWLSIELTDDEENGEFDGYVFAEVFAEPLPQGVYYREAVVRFECPGAYLDYKFMQGGIIPPEPCFPGEITIAVVNYLIDLIFNDMYDDCYDINEDGELTVADVNGFIHYILTH